MTLAAVFAIALPASAQDDDAEPAAAAATGDDAEQVLQAVALSLSRSLELEEQAFSLDWS